MNRIGVLLAAVIAIALTVYGIIMLTNVDDAQQNNNPAIEATDAVLQNEADIELQTVGDYPDCGTGAPPGGEAIAETDVALVQPGEGIIANDTPGYLGLTVQDVEACGVSVAAIDPNGPAAESELAVGDVIIAINDIPISILVSQETENYVEVPVTASADGTPVAPEGTPTHAAPSIVFVHQVQLLAPRADATLTVQRGEEQLRVAVVAGDLPQGAASGGSATSGS